MKSYLKVNDILNENSEWSSTGWDKIKQDTAETKWTSFKCNRQQMVLLMQCAEKDILCNDGVGHCLEPGLLQICKIKHQI